MDLMDGLNLLKDTLPVFINFAANVGANSYPKGLKSSAPCAVI